MNDYKRVEIDFEDHYSIGDDWTLFEDHQEIRILKAIGWLAKEDEKYFYITSTYDMETKKFQAGTAILKNCVVSFLELGPLTESQMDEESKPKSRRSRR